MKHKLNGRQKEMRDMRRNNFIAINEPKGKTSEPHKCLHKIFDYERIKLNKSKVFGRLDKLYSEVPYHNVPCGTDLTITVGHQEYSAEIVYNTAHADALEIYRDKHGQVYTRVVEILPQHNYQAYFPNCKSGKIWANDFKEFMWNKGYFDEDIYDSFERQLSRDPPSNDPYGEGLKRYEYNFAPELYNSRHELQRQKITYSKFEPFVEKESVIERKHRIYGQQADSMIFVILKPDLPACIDDIHNLISKCSLRKNPFNIEMILTIEEKQYWETIRLNGGLKRMSKTEDSIKTPRDGKYSPGKYGIFEVYDIEDILSGIYEQCPSDKMLMYN